MKTIFNYVTLIYDEFEKLEEVRKKAINIFDPIIMNFSPNFKTDGDFISHIYKTPANKKSYFIINSCGEYTYNKADKRLADARREFVQYCEDIKVVHLATLEFGSSETPFLVDSL